jgi:hypothetical protein
MFLINNEGLEQIHSGLTSESRKVESLLPNISRRHSERSFDRKFKGIYQMRIMQWNRITC